MRVARKHAVAFDYEAAFSRNLGVFSPIEQTLLRNRHVAIPGCGGVGGIHAMALARMGVGRFTIADFDTFEVENFNRQFGAKISTLGEEKVEVIRREILDINPEAQIRTFRNGITEENVAEFLSGIDLVIDSLDFFAFQARDLLFPAAQRLKVPLLTAAPLGMSCALLLFTGDSMSYEDYFRFSREDSTEERALKFSLALAPKGNQRKYLDSNYIRFDEKRGPSHVSGVLLCAAMAAAEGVKILLDKGSCRSVPYFRQFDAYRGELKHGYLWWGNANPIQKIKMVLGRHLLRRMKKEPHAP